MQDQDPENRQKSQICEESKRAYMTGAYTMYTIRVAAQRGNASAQSVAFLLVTSQYVTLMY